MSLPVHPPISPMLAKLTPEIPHGPEWVYEPKWDGFRAIVFRERERIRIASRNALPLERYFPELVDILAHAFDEPCVVDGEIIIAGEHGLDFEALQLRLHPAASRVAMLAKSTPSSFVAFDMLAAGEEDLRPLPFHQRRARLMAGMRSSDRCFPTPQTDDPKAAEAWFERFEGAGLDGVIAKRNDGPYVEGERAMAKIKHQRTADCVVGGYRLSKDGKTLGSLLLGLYDDAGTLRHVGHTSAFNAAARRETLAMLQSFRSAESFTGEYGPGGPSRWNQGRDMTWEPVRPEVACEVSFDHMQGPRFRHAARFLRWRPDKAASDCTFDQLQPPAPFSLKDIVRLGSP